jgi:hypothetical protein
MSSFGCILILTLRRRRNGRLLTFAISGVKDSPLGSDMTRKKHRMMGFMLKLRRLPFDLTILV